MEGLNLPKGTLVRDRRTGHEYLYKENIMGTESDFLNTLHAEAEELGERAVAAEPESRPIPEAEVTIPSGSTPGSEVESRVWKILTAIGILLFAGFLLKLMRPASPAKSGS
jgi:hypothetical protein